MKKITFEQSANITGGSRLTSYCYFVPFITLLTSGSTQGLIGGITWNAACWKN